MLKIQHILTKTLVDRFQHKYKIFFTVYEQIARNIHRRIIRLIYPSFTPFFFFPKYVIIVAVDLSAGENVYRKHVCFDWSFSSNSGKLMMIVHGERTEIRQI